MKQQEISPEVSKEARAKYQHYPGALAVANLLVDKAILSNKPILAKGSAWGGVHMEGIGEVVTKLAEEMYRQNKRELILRLGPKDSESDYDHYFLEIVDIK
jgi:hypothetical protein